MKRFLLILIVLGVIGAGVVEWANAAWDAPGLPAADGKETVILIAPGSRTHTVAQIFEQKGIMKSGLMFEFDLRMRGLAGKIKAGEYAVPSQASMRTIATILVEGKSIQHKLTAAEGLTSDMIWKLVQADKALVGDAGAVPAEGSLLPETYLFTRGETRAHLLARMAKAQEKFLDEKWPDSNWSGRTQGLPLRSAREAVILASIVEKETSLPEERRHIAAVFINRLKIGMRLQTDPTVIYGMGPRFDGNIRKKDLSADTPWNTYTRGGLPPTPIAMPGKASLLAAVQPAKSNALYFVARGDGSSHFSASLDEHNRAVNKYQRGQ